MKTEITITGYKCDTCGKVEATFRYCCESCHMDFCPECWRKHGTMLHMGVCVSGSLDGEFCNKCIQQLRCSGLGHNPRFDALMRIQALRAEQAAWLKDFEQRRKAAEEKLQSLPQK